MTCSHWISITIIIIINWSKCCCSNFKLSVLIRKPSWNCIVTKEWLRRRQQKIIVLFYGTGGKTNGSPDGKWLSPSMDIYTSRNTSASARTRGRGLGVTALTHATKDFLNTGFLYSRGITSIQPAFMDETEIWLFHILYFFCWRSFLSYPQQHISRERYLAYSLFYVWWHLNSYFCSKNTIIQSKSEQKYPRRIQTFFSSIVELWSRSYYNARNNALCYWLNALKIACKF